MGDMGECGGAENIPPNETPSPTSGPNLPKKLKLSLNKPRFERVSDEDISVISKVYQISLKVQNGVCARNNGSTDEDKCPDDLLERPEVTKLIFWLCRFVAEVCGSDSQPYPPKSVYQIICGILRFMRSIDPACLNFLDRRDTWFRDFRCSC